MRAHCSHTHRHEQHSHTHQRIYPSADDDDMRMETEMNRITKRNKKWRKKTENNKLSDAIKIHRVLSTRTISSDWNSIWCARAKRQVRECVRHFVSCHTSTRKLSSADAAQCRKYGYARLRPLRQRNRPPLRWCAKTHLAYTHSC